MTRILKIDPIKPSQDSIREAAEVIKCQGTVAFPTETVYGLGANGFDDLASMKIFKAKKRPSDNPLIIHINSIDQLSDVAKDVPEDFYQIASKVWPGPITFILQKADNVLKVARCGLDTVAVRIPAHPIALELIKASGVPIAAPSANIATKPSCTRVKDVIQDFDGVVDLIIDGGDAFFGMESTVIDARDKHRAVILRPGVLGIEELAKYIPNISYDRMHNLKNDQAPLSPGMKYRHYAPSTKLILIEDLELFLQCAKESAKLKLKVCAISSNQIADQIGKNIEVIRLGDQANGYQVAKNLFASFREIDKQEASFGIIHSFDEKGIGLAIMNRIRKGCSFEVSSLQQFLALVN